MKLDTLSAYAGEFSEYTELRVQENRSTVISILNGDVNENSVAIERGSSARVFKNGVWGFASSPESGAGGIKNVIKKATDNALFLDSREKKGDIKLPSGSGQIIKDFSTAKKRLTRKELIEFVREVDEYAVKKFPALTSRKIVLWLLDMEKSLITSDGAASFSMIPRSILAPFFSVEVEGQPFQLYEIFDGFGQFEDVFSRPDLLYPRLDALYEQLMEKARGVQPEAGVFECILDADMAGILAHEAIGHTVEADLVLGGSIAAEYMNEQVASPLVTMIDYAHHARGELCPVPVFMDDEGVMAEDAVIIEKGVLKSYLHNKDSARHFGAEPKGNARAYTYADEPLIRMRNTGIVPGESSLEQMIASIDKGYYLMRPSNGQADFTSEFMFGVTMGYEIKNGKLGRAIQDTTIAGVAFDVLKDVSMISSQVKWSCGGMCGKKQLIPVGQGGPAVKCKVSVGGK